MPTLKSSIMMVLCLGAVGPIRADRLVKEDSQVKIYSRDPILPHGYGEMILEFNGKRYGHLFSPGYAVTPDKKGIIFVTSKEVSSATLHFVPFKGHDEIKVDLGDSPFGIGLGFPKGDLFAHYIEGMDGKSIILVARFGKNTMERRFLLNLEARTFSEVATSPTQKE